MSNQRCVRYCTLFLVFAVMAVCSTSALADVINGRVQAINQVGDGWVVSVISDNKNYSFYAFAAGDRNAWASAVQRLKPGQTVTIEYSPPVEWHGTDEVGRPHGIGHAIRVVTQTKQDFLKRYRASEIVQLGELQSNPFRYEGKVVAVPCSFAQMLSKDVALFQTGFGAMGIASGAPATRFKGGEGVILVGKVVGQKQIDPGGGWGQVKVPNIRFQVAYSCDNGQCDSILGQ